MMFTQRYRPQTFAKIVGQEEAVDFFRFLALSPQSAPRVILLHGPYGVGKTTLARVYARASVCEGLTSKAPDVCGECNSCRGSILTEYDSLDLADSSILNDARYSMSIDTGLRRVIIFDEIQLLSRQSQGSLLKAIEEISPSLVAILITTEPSQVIDTIRSRSIEVPVYPLSEVAIAAHLSYVASEEGFSLGDDVARSIALSADGHLRNALMALNRYSLTGSTDFITLLRDIFMHFFESSLDGNRQEIEQLLSEISSHPLASVRRSLHVTVSEFVRVAFINDKDSEYFRIAKRLGNGVITVLRHVTEPWFQQAFRDEHLAISALWTLYRMINGQQASRTSTADVSPGLRNE